MDYTEKIFEMLEIKPEKIFYLSPSHDGEGLFSQRPDCKYWFSKTGLLIEICDNEQHVNNDLIPWILNGTFEIVKNSLQQDPELIAFKYLD